MKSYLLFKAVPFNLPQVIQQESQTHLIPYYVDLGKIASFFASSFLQPPSSHQKTGAQFIVEPFISAVLYILFPMTFVG